MPEQQQLLPQEVSPEVRAILDKFVETNGPKIETLRRLAVGLSQIRLQLEQVLPHIAAINHDSRSELTVDPLIKELAGLGSITSVDVQTIHKHIHATYNLLLQVTHGRTEEQTEKAIRDQIREGLAEAAYRGSSTVGRDRLQIRTQEAGGPTPNYGSIRESINTISAASGVYADQNSAHTGAVHSRGYVTDARQATAETTAGGRTSSGTSEARG